MSGQTQHNGGAGQRGTEFSMQVLSVYANLDDKKLKDMNKPIESGNFEHVNSYIFLIGEFLGKSVLKTAAKVVGGGAVGTLVAGRVVGRGVATSIITGFFTFGIGTVIGLGITGVAATAAVGGGVGGNSVPP